jgi:putative transposase
MLSMANREKIIVGEYYHIYNRGVDKRSIVTNSAESDRFMDSVKYFNSKEPIESLYHLSFNRDQLSGSTAKLVEIVAYCLNPNHYHFVLKEIIKGGISEFMKRLGGGYTWYFNNKHKRSGSLLQGRFKSVHIKSDSQLRHVSAYVNLNWKAHGLSGSTAKLVRSSWDEYMGNVPVEEEICLGKGIILEHFESSQDYKNFAEEAIRSAQTKKNEGITSGRYLFE